MPRMNFLVLFSQCVSRSDLRAKILKLLVLSLDDGKLRIAYRDEEKRERKRKETPYLQENDDCRSQILILGFVIENQYSQANIFSINHSQLAGRIRRGGSGIMMRINADQNTDGYRKMMKSIVCQLLCHQTCVKTACIHIWEIYKL